MAAPALLIYVALNLRQTSTVVKVFFGLAMLLILSSGGTSLSSSDILAGLERMVFLGALLTALGFMRVVATHDTHFIRAGRYLISQPPARRYLSMYAGGHLFTTLLNMGGLGLLVETVNRALEARRDSLSPLVFQLRQRRIVSAIMRGFSTIAFWTPFGIALNSLLLVFPDLHWIDVAPFGLLFAGTALIFGWSQDSIERRLRPLHPRPQVDAPEPGDHWSALFVVLHILGLGTVIFTLDVMLPVSFQSVLLFVVPIYALIWIVWLFGQTGPATLKTGFIERAPSFVTEIGVFSMAGLLGPMIAALIPEAAMNPLFSVVGAQPVILALALLWTTVLFSVIGVHPIISVIVLGELVVRNGGISELAATLALLSGWAGAVTLAPFATTSVFISRLVNQGVWRVSWGWNGVYSFGVLLLFSLLLSVGILLGFF
ncbi:hypothetical protein [Granulosicoccus antarcticus]|uniref:Citrate transporter-like domain-containing protein n=1 Tax=Granulosicoccus antarcticus IMCC3135 TaxID=1192854 RepID=A0A2Z2NPA5_9GAMM|nr:hypothetical protein [Granulosicoccus antarcticus]ASJ73266.1 hypothetical protein IMCC3135_15920 [Granulosicoccus antarcticus IMCC3135]